MAPLPKGYSFQAGPVQSALSEGRTDDAERLVVEILRSGKADAVVQLLAAEMIRPQKRPSRGRKKSLPHHWFEIAETFHSLRGHGERYEAALRIVADKFGYSESHVRNALDLFAEAKAAHDEATAELSD